MRNKTRLDLIKDYGYPALCVIEQEFRDNLALLTRLHKAMRPLDRGSVVLVRREDNEFDLYCRGMKQGIRELPSDYVEQIEKLRPLKIDFNLESVVAGVSSGSFVIYHCLLVDVKEEGFEGSYMFFTR